MSARGGVGVKVSTDLKKAIREVNRVQRLTIPDAKKIAFKEASMKTITAASREIAARARVPYWMVRGVGVTASSTKSGSRLGRSGYIKKLDGVILFLRHTHINPTGTVARPADVQTLKKGGVRVRGVGAWPNAFYVKNSRNGTIFENVGSGRDDFRKVQIDLDPWAGEALKAIANFMLFPTFRNRFAHQIERMTRTRS